MCGGAPKCNGLGYGLLTHHRPDLLPEKLDAMLAQYDWDNGRWGGTCFGIYDGVRPLKALAAALGFDSAAVGGVRPDGCRELEIARSGTGNGFVLSADSGLDCGTDCSESWPLDTSVTLSATSYEGSTFAGWSGTGCEGGQVTLGVDTTCTASFDGTCTDPLNLAPEQITGIRRFAGCGHVTAGDGFEILANGDVEFRAGGRVSLSSGFRVAVGGALRIIAGAE